MFVRQPSTPIIVTCMGERLGQHGSPIPDCARRKAGENDRMTDEDDVTTLRFRIEGFVQAVGYRNFAI